MAPPAGAALALGQERPWHPVECRHQTHLVLNSNAANWVKAHEQQRVNMVLNIGLCRTGFSIASFATLARAYAVTRENAALCVRRRVLCRRFHGMTAALQARKMHAMMEITTTMITSGRVAAGERKAYETAQRCANEGGGSLAAAVSWGGRGGGGGPP